MALSNQDLGFLERTLDLAKEGRYAAFPNPLVGAVVVRDNRVIAEGWHQAAGQPHAEIEAFLDADRRGSAVDLSGATLYVNLEPCNHVGRTGPCTDAVIKRGIARVVCCHRDPNPIAEGGAELLRRTGIAVDFAARDAGSVEADLLASAVSLNARFLVPLVRSRALVTLKWAMSMDGKIATRTGESQWISSPEGRDWALDLRELHDAILVGSGTALADDPRLTRRAGKASGAIARVVMDRRLRLSPKAVMLDESGPVIIYCAENALSDPVRKQRQRDLQARGAEVALLPSVSPRAVVQDLFARGLFSLLVEGGGQIQGAFSDEQLVDLVAVCCAPLVIGGEDAPGPVGGNGTEQLASAVKLGQSSGRQIGPDWVIEGIENGCLQDLLSNVAV